MISTYKYILIIIVCVAYILRVHGIDWDHGFNLHPDERAIIMFTNDLLLPSSFTEFLSPTSPLNPAFFAYGSFPLYLLKIISSIASVFDASLATYDKMALVGRIISAVADVGTIFIVFFITRKLFSPFIGLFAASIYTLSVFPIQTSHFYAVDILLTFFCTLSIFLLLKMTEKVTVSTSIFAGLSFGLALATKISSIVLGLPIIVFFVIAFLQNYKHYKKKKSLQVFKNLIVSAVVFSTSTVAIFFITQPYALIDWQNFILQTREQSKMTHDVFTFPYTMQYYGKIPYVYELKNIFFWGLGPIVTVLSGFGVWRFLKYINKGVYHFRMSLVLLSFVVPYFLIVGNFAVGWMRYMLPLYPFFAIFAGIAIVDLLKIFKSHRYTQKVLCVILAIGIAYWPISFIQIYGGSHPRVTATNWILENIPAGSVLATEHWDDRLPLERSDMYTFAELPMYDSDTDLKWDLIQQKLNYSDYLILSSNRLYTPLQKLTNCTELPEGRCYPTTAEFYTELLSGKTKFKKIAEFTNYPTIPFTNITINDQSADESFTVYDHPKVLIFKNTDAIK